MSAIVIEYLELTYVFLFSMLVFKLDLKRYFQKYVLVFFFWAIQRTPILPKVLAMALRHDFFFFFFTK